MFQKQRSFVILLGGYFTLHVLEFRLIQGKFVSAERAIWIYAFTKNDLNKYYGYKNQTPLEKIEDNEIIRFSEIGIPVYCVDVIGDSWAVDEKKDLKIVENLIVKRNIK